MLIKLVHIQGRDKIIKLVDIMKICIFASATSNAMHSKEQFVRVFLETVL